MTCRGNEESRLWTQGTNPPQVAVKSSPLSVNFRLSNDQVVDKSTTANLVASTNELVHFNAHAPAFWLAGQFN